MKKNVLILLFITHCLFASSFATDTRIHDALSEIYKSDYFLSTRITSFFHEEGYKDALEKNWMLLAENKKILHESYIVKEKTHRKNNSI